MMNYPQQAVNESFQQEPQGVVGQAPVEQVVSLLHTKGPLCISNIRNETWLGLELRLTRFLRSPSNAIVA